MKKIFSIFSAFIIYAVIFTGCGENKTTAPEVKLGMIKHLNASESEFNEFIKKVSSTFSIQLTSYDPIFYDNLNSMLLALDSGEIKVISTYDCVARYITTHNPNYEMMIDDTLEFIDAFCFAMLEEKSALQNDLNKCIREIRDDGTLDRLTKEYITDVNEKDPSAVEFQHFDGAETIKIAVTGDLPPLDLVLANGEAAGFNTALLAEMGKRLNKNIEIIHVDSAARASVLNSKRVDLIFWAIVPVSEIIPANADKPAGTILSEPYYRGRIVHIKLKN